MSPKTVFLVLMLAYFVAVAVATLVWRRKPVEYFGNYAAELAHFKALPPAGRAAYLQLPRAAKLQLPIG